MNLTFLRWLLFGLLMFVAGFVHAEGQCPPGMFPTNAPGTQGPVGCAPIPGYNNQQQGQPRPAPSRWESRWGAIATDATRGSLGTATSLPSKVEAERVSLADCQSKGGTNCKLQLTYDNECAAMVVGDKVFDVTADISVNRAVQAGMTSCAKANDHTCRVYYSDCSLPVRIQ